MFVPSSSSFCILLVRLIVSTGNNSNVHCHFITAVNIIIIILIMFTSHANDDGLWFILPELAVCECCYGFVLRALLIVVVTGIHYAVLRSYLCLLSWFSWCQEC